MTHKISPALLARQARELVIQVLRHNGQFPDEPWTSEPLAVMRELSSSAHLCALSTCSLCLDIFIECQQVLQAASHRFICM